MQMTTIRVFYAKTARAKYISHLDTMRTVTRALRRSGLPLWYTEGFNPHLYITFALPISLGYEGLRESFDIRLLGAVDLKAIAGKIRSAMPPGFNILEAALPVMEPKAITWGDYEVRLLYKAETLPKIKESLAVFNRQPAIIVVKKTKKGDTTVDIRPNVQNLGEEWSGEGALLRLRAAAGINLNINPTLYLKAFYDWSGEEPEGVRVVRTAVLDEHLREFC